MKYIGTHLFAACLFASIFAVSGNSLQGQEQTFKATKRGECAKASRRLSQLPNNEAMRSVRESFAPGTPFYIDREKQYREFWLVSRYNDNLGQCNRWFDSGRTSPFTPS